METPKQYNPMYLKYRETILANAKKYQKQKNLKRKEEKNRAIALEYIKKMLEKEGSLNSISNGL